MLFKKQLILMLGFLSFFLLQGQKEANNWYFGDRAGITFNTKPPTALTKGQMYTNEGCASISAPNGRLLFYTDGVNVWDSTHKIMPNGYALNGNATSTQSAIIVPKPENPQIYYIFTVAPEATMDGLQYSEIDMSLNSGKGDIVSTKKNIKLKSQVAEKITAVKKKNSNDYWVLAARFYSDSFFAFSVTKTGVGFTPVSYRTGFALFGKGINAIGYLKISPNGKKIAFANNTFDTSAVGDFDASTGRIYNLWKFYSHYGYGVEFSPKTKYLYTTETGNYKVYQYDLSVKSSGAFTASKRIVDSTYSFSPGALQLGPDGRIYISMITGQYLSVIHSPDLLNCNPQKDYIYLGGRYSHYGLPTFIQSFFQDTSILVSRKCLYDSTTFLIAEKSDVDSVRWDFDDPASGGANTSALKNGAYHIYQSTGNYTARLTTYLNGISSAMSVKFSITKAIKPALGRDSALCNNFTLTLQPQKNYTRYDWTPANGSSKSISISQAGTYILTVADSNDCRSADTIDIRNPKVSAELELSDTAACLKGNNFSIKTHSKIINDRQSKMLLYFEDNTVTADSIINRTYLKSGTYQLKLVVESTSLCRDSMSKTLRVFAEYPVFIGNDTTFCGGFAYQLKAGNPYRSYQWNTGDTTMQIYVTNTGSYSIKVVDQNGCQYADTINIEAVPKPVITIAYDSVSCQFVYLSTDSLMGTTYLWSTGEITKDIFVNSKKWYSVTANKNLCSISDSILVDRLAMPEVELGDDIKLCTPEIVLKTGESGAYLWNTLETRPSITIREPGKYWLTVSRNNCSATDSVNVKICEEMTYYVPDAFSPNDDNTNDIFRIYGTNIALMELEIFNHWGELIYKAEGKDVYWDGTYKNTICMEGVYFYTLTLKGDKAGRVAYLKGSINLVR